jgi:hypothetical protein
VHDRAVVDGDRLRVARDGRRGNRREGKRGSDWRSVKHVSLLVSFRLVSSRKASRIRGSIANHRQIGLPYRRYIRYPAGDIPTAVAHGIRQAIRLPRPPQFPDSFRLRPLVKGQFAAPFAI